MESDEIESLPSTSEMTESFIAEAPQELVFQNNSDFAPLSDNQSAQKIRKRRKAVRIHPKFRQNVLSTSDLESSDTFFAKRKITTIHEGVVFKTELHPSTRARRENFRHRDTTLSQGKALNQKVAAVRAFAYELRRMAPQLLDNSLNDETISLFNSINIK